MPDQIDDQTLSNEAKVISETTTHKTEESTPNQVTTTTQTTTVTTDTVPMKKKKNPILIILGVLFGAAALCCVTAVVFFFAITAIVQKTPQAIAVKALFTALNDGKETTVKSLTSTVLYADLYREDADGNSMASTIKGEIESVNVSSVEVTNNIATVSFSIKAKDSDKQDFFSSAKTAELQKKGDEWIVTYIGDGSDETPTPTAE